MHPDKVNRQSLDRLTDLPNIGEAGARDLQLLGYSHPKQLRDADPLDMYQRLCHITGQTHDPCVLDVFMSVTRFMAGQPAQPWWAYTDERKLWLTGTAR